MKNEFVPYELAVKLKEIGFNEPCMFVHDTWGNTKNWTEDGEGEHRNSHINASIYYSAPLFQQVFRWFREKHNLHNGIYPYYDEYEFQIKDFRLPTNQPINGGLMPYEDAELACLEKLIELVEQKDK